nr:MAG TPA: hypothetical protein [Caudoviricetes sp.]
MSRGRRRELRPGRLILRFFRLRFVRFKPPTIT